MREDAIAHQKRIIAKENELVGIIEEVEIYLKTQEDSIKDQIEAEKRKKILPQRLEELAKI